MEEISKVLSLIRRNKLYPEIKIVEGGISSSPEFVVNGRKILSFCSGNFLGLANNEQVKKAITEGLNRYGVHPSGSVLISGTLKIHRRLEKEIADFIGKEDAMIFTTSTMANMGVVPAIVNIPLTSLFTFFQLTFNRGKNAVLFSDEFNHATIIEGCRLAKAKKIVYKHCDMDDLKKKLKKYKGKRNWILTDGVFSTDGDIAPLKDIIGLAKRYGARVFVDDANGTGVLGKNGRGTMEHFGLKDGVDIIVTSFSKAIGVVGGTAIASKEVIDYLRVTAKPYIFSGAFLGSLAMGILKSLEIIKKDKRRRARCWDNTIYFKNKIHQAGFNTLNNRTPLVPILIRDERKAVQMSNDLFECGILSPPLRWPAVPHNQARMRFTITSEYSKDQIDRLVDNLIVIGKRYQLIQ
ncbi:MAG: aminotransferase class I/II-fold pyridoxal phosphate-dependent enzyme [Candidatus Bathyarchaeota archaeon]|nr:aminotransferase class I/II-fold pyridoxal phosphate-dependent enzyme [Candidatus Bathyarchaeota archaeon]